MDLPTIGFYNKKQNCTTYLYFIKKSGKIYIRFGEPDLIICHSDISDLFCKEVAKNEKKDLSCIKFQTQFLNDYSAEGAGMVEIEGKSCKLRPGSRVYSVGNIKLVTETLKASKAFNNVTPF